MSIPYARAQLIIIFLILAFSAHAQNSQTRFAVSGSVDWARAEINAQASFDLAEAGIRLPAGRFTGEEILEASYPRLLRPFLLTLRVDSSSTLGNLVERGEFSLEEADTLCREAEKIPASLSRDLGQMTGRYTLRMENISALLNRQRRAVEPARPLVPVQTADYTGIIIIAEEELPIHGRNSRSLLEPCLSPKIWDTDMTLIYERAMLDPVSPLAARYTAPENIFRPTPSGLEGELAGFLGPNPLRILARGVFGINPTDPVIDRADALKILSSENNRRLLREGRVAFVINSEILTARLNF